MVKENSLADLLGSLQTYFTPDLTSNFLFFFKGSCLTHPPTKSMADRKDLNFLWGNSTSTNRCKHWFFAIDTGQFGCYVTHCCGPSRAVPLARPSMRWKGVHGDWWREQTLSAVHEAINKRSRYSTFKNWLRLKGIIYTINISCKHSVSYHMSHKNNTTD